LWRTRCASLRKPAIPAGWDTDAGDGEAPSVEQTFVRGTLDQAPIPGATGATPPAPSDDFDSHDLLLQFLRDLVQ
jgi:hypothetical protein